MTLNKGLNICFRGESETISDLKISI
jgi:hypothetical protein